MVSVFLNDPRILQLVGHLDFDKNNHYSVSPFVYSIRTTLGNYLAINTFTSALCEISSNIFDLLCKKNVDLSLISENDILTLCRYRFIVNCSEDELKLYTETYELLLNLDSQRTGKNRYNILTTTGCNAQCFYCFENDFIKRAENMTAETAEKVSKYIIATAASNNKIYLRWFGGEPLVNTKAIDVICSNMKTNNIDFFSSVSTNGLLLDNELLQAAHSKWNLTKVRITLDGYGNEHNIRKNFKGSYHDNAFEIIMRNIHTIVESGIIMTVRMNIDKNNIDSIQLLTEYLIKEFKGCDNFNVYCRCFFDDLRTEKVSSTKGRLLLNERNKIEDVIISNRMYDWEKMAPNFFRLHFCAAQDHRKIVILPNGRLCNCECYASDEVSWGCVGNDTIDSKVYKYWNEKEKEIRKRCKNCAFLPLCTPFSRCPMNYIDCKERISHTIELFMKESHYRYIHKINPISQIDSIKSRFVFNAP